MALRTTGYWTVTVALALGLARIAPCDAAERTALDGAAVIVERDSPSSVRHAADDLAGFLRETTGSAVPVAESEDVEAPVRIAIGPETARRLLGDSLRLDDLGEEGFVLRAFRRDGASWIVAAGSAPSGTHAGVCALMRAIEVDETTALVPADLEVRHAPAFAKRGMHFNGWAFRHPYTFRSWRAEDWRRFLDILAYQGVNLFYLWPFMEILPVPLSVEDQAYLEECRQVVEYAHAAHGMEVWIMQCTNRVARDRCGVADPRHRPYWRPCQEDLDPGKPEHLQAILASREALYRAVNNVDGVCNIDSDPGYLPGSPLEDYVKVLDGCRELLDRHNLLGRQAKLVNWMWCGWGLPSARAFEPAHQARTLDFLREGLPEPWGVVCGSFGFLPLCRENGVIGKTVLLPYGLIEDEPSYPATNLRIDQLRTELATHVAPGSDLLGVMGNVQTPLLQLPHLWAFTSWIEDAGTRGKSERDVLLDLSRHVYPEHARLLTDGYLALREPDPAGIRAVADRLEDLVEAGRLGRPGIIGRKLFPDFGVVARILLLQLRLREAQERLATTTEASGPAEWSRRLREYLDAYLAWDTAHGWHDLWGWRAWPLGGFASDPRIPAITGRIRKSWGDEKAVEERLHEIVRDLSSRHDPRAVREGAVAPFRTAILDASPVSSLAQKAVATASVVPDPVRYPPGQANDGLLATLYWPGALVKDNTEWLELAWAEPQAFDTVIVRFLQHPSMVGRTIRLQREIRPDAWEDIATAVIPDEPSTRHSVATFRLAPPASLAKVRVVNLLDLFEVEVR